MPIYKYKCEDCEEYSTFINKPTIVKTKSDANGKDSDVGTITKQFIEENREVLNKQKEEYSKKQYDKP